MLGSAFRIWRKCDTCIRYSSDSRTDVAHRQLPNGGHQFRKGDSRNLMCCRWRSWSSCLPSFFSRWLERGMSCNQWNSRPHLHDSSQRLYWCSPPFQVGSWWMPCSLLSLLILCWPCLYRPIISLVPFSVLLQRPRSRLLPTLFDHLQLLVQPLAAPLVALLVAQVPLQLIQGRKVDQEQWDFHPQGWSCSL